MFEVYLTESLCTSHITAAQIEICEGIPMRSSLPTREQADGLGSLGTALRDQYLLPGTVGAGSRQSKHPAWAKMHRTLKQYNHNKIF